MALQLLNSDISWNLGTSDSNVENIYTKSLYINNVNFEPSARNIVYRQSDLDTNLTNTNNLQLPGNYFLPITPTNASSKFRIKLKIGYLIGWENDQKISFNLYRLFDNSFSLINNDDKLSIGNQQDAAFLIYTLDYIDTLFSSPATTFLTTFLASFEISLSKFLTPDSFV